MFEWQIIGTRRFNIIWTAVVFKSYYWLLLGILEKVSVACDGERTPLVCLSIRSEFESLFLTLSLYWLVWTVCLVTFPPPDSTKSWRQYQLLRKITTHNKRGQLENITDLILSCKLTNYCQKSTACSRMIKGNKYTRIDLLVPHPVLLQLTKSEIW